MSKFITKANLCSCNMCSNILIDTNAQIGAKMYDIDALKVKSLEVCEDEDGYFKGCPECKTDGYLNDDIDETKAKELGIIE